MEAAGEEKKKKKAGDKPGAKKMADNKVRVRYEHVGGENKYMTYYNKLRIKVIGKLGPGAVPPPLEAKRCLYRSAVPLPLRVPIAQRCLYRAAAPLPVSTLL